MICLFTCQPIGLPACLPAQPHACWHACLPVCLSTYQPIGLPACLLACLPICIPAYRRACLQPACLPTCLFACLDLFIRASNVLLCPKNFVFFLSFFLSQRTKTFPQTDRFDLTFVLEMREGCFRFF
jgi:hypothetical protein